MQKNLPELEQLEDRYSRTLQWGFLGSLGYDLGERHRFNFTAFHNRSIEQNVTLMRMGMDSRALDAGGFGSASVQLVRPSPRERVNIFAPNVIDAANSPFGEELTHFSAFNQSIGNFFGSSSGKNSRMRRSPWCSASRREP